MLGLWSVVSPPPHLEKLRKEARQTAKFCRTLHGKADTSSTHKLRHILSPTYTITQDFSGNARRSYSSPALKTVVSSHSLKEVMASDRRKSTSVYRHMSANGTEMYTNPDENAIVLADVGGTKEWNEVQKSIFLIGDAGMEDHKVDVGVLVTPVHSNVSKTCVQSSNGIAKKQDNQDKQGHEQTQYHLDSILTRTSTSSYSRSASSADPSVCSSEEDDGVMELDVGTGMDINKITLSNLSGIVIPTQTVVKSWDSQKMQLEGPVASIPYLTKSEFQPFNTVQKVVTAVFH
eukprot:CFRG0609T1